MFYASITKADNSWKFLYVCVQKGEDPDLARKMLDGRPHQKSSIRPDLVDPQPCFQFFYQLKNTETCHAIEFSGLTSFFAAENLAKQNFFMCLIKPIC